MVNMIYKCRKCQEVFSSIKFNSVDEAVSAMMVLSGADSTGRCVSNPVSIREIHKCYSGGLGIADLLGFIEVQDEGHSPNIENVEDNQQLEEDS